MLTHRPLFVLACVFIALLVLDSRAQDIDDQAENNKRQAPKINIRVNRANNKRHDDSNEIEATSSKNSNGDDSSRTLVMAEPYKSLLQFTTRLALTRTNLSKHIDLDNAMSLLSDVAYFLSKPSHLMLAVKLVSVFVVSSLGLSFLLPGGSRFVESVWQDPSNSLDLDRYLSNGTSEQSVLEVVNARTDEAWSRVGDEARLCRQVSMCHFGEILHCFLPRTSKMVIKFARDNFSSKSNPFKNRPMAEAFVSGFVERNCTRLASLQAQPSDMSSRSASQQSTSCLGDWLVSVFGHRSGYKDK